MFRPLLSILLLISSTAPELAAQSPNRMLDLCPMQSFEAGLQHLAERGAEAPLAFASRGWPALVDWISAREHTRDHQAAAEKPSDLPMTAGAIPFAAPPPVRASRSLQNVRWDPPAPDLSTAPGEVVTLRLVSPEPLVLSVAGMLILAAAFLTKRRP